MWNLLLFFKRTAQERLNELKLRVNKAESEMDRGLLNGQIIRLEIEIKTLTGLMAAYESERSIEQRKRHVG